MNVELLRNQAYIAGQWRDSADGRVFDVTNPATGALIGTVPDMDAGDAQSAIAAAREAWPTWRDASPKERAALLRRWFELVTAYAYDLARLLTAESGKPLAEARGEVTYGAAFIEWFAEEAKRTYGDVIPSPTADRRILVVKQPIGVCAAITPWNFPIAMITRKCAPALAVGCTMVVKPAEATPLSALALAALADSAGIPPGVFNVVTAAQGAAVGLEFCRNPDVRKLSFTGSTAVGKLLLRECAGTVKRVSLELGGNAPFIVFEDADLEAAVAGAMASKFRNSGQTCVCANRFLVQDSVYEVFAEKLAAAVAGMKVANGFEDGLAIGPLINEAALAKVERHVADAVGKGARVLIGGDRHPRGRTYFAPTVLADVSGEMAVATEETFGPVAPLMRFSSEDEAVALSNATDAGLAAYVYSRDIGRCWRVAERLECGMVGINEGIISTEVAPFGGVKQSGLGREGSRYGAEEYLEIKYLCLGGLDR